MCFYVQYLFPNLMLADWIFAYYFNNPMLWRIGEKMYWLALLCLVIPVYRESTKVATWKYQLAWMLLTPVTGAMLFSIVVWVCCETVIHPRNVYYTKASRSSDSSHRKDNKNSRQSNIPWQYIVLTLITLFLIFEISSGRLTLEFLLIFISVSLVAALFVSKV